MENSQQHGITALELMVTMAIVAILLATGVPAFKNYGWNLRMKTAMDVLHTDLNLAKGRAISHNIQTVICPGSGINECSGESDWENGWIVFTDLNGDHQKQSGEPVIRKADATEFMRISSSRSRSYLRFYPNGTAPGSNISILFCDKRGSAYAHKILVSNTGRIRMDTKGSEPTENCP